MKKNTVSILLHTVNLIFFIFAAHAILAHGATFLQQAGTLLFLFIYIAFILIRLHLKSINTQNMFTQYDTDAVNQQRMLTLQKAILELSSEMTKVNGLNELLDIILKKAIEVMPEASFGSILVMNPEGKLEFKALSGFNQDLFRFKLDPTESYQWCATGGHFTGPLIIQDLQEFSKDIMTDETFTLMNDIEALNPRSSLSAPLLIDGDFFGSINIDSLETNVFTEEHKKLMAYFANQATIAIRNHQYYEKMLFLSKYDGLTGVINRHYFQEIIETMLQKGSRKKDPITFVLLDLNRFKAINDQYGHVSGDHILSVFAKSFSGLLRHSDLFARYGGDEFIAVFFNSDLAKTAHKLEMIYETITHEPIKLPSADQQIYCLFSYGMAEFPLEGTELKTLIHLADQRMYDHKKIKK